MSDLSDVQSQIENVISILSRFQTSILRQTEEGLGSFSQSLSEVVPDEVARNGQGVDNCLESVYEHVEKRVMEYFPALEEFVVTRLAIPPKDLVAPPAADLVPAVSDVELAVATAQIEDLYKKIIYAKAMNQFYLERIQQYGEIASSIDPHSQDMEKFSMSLENFSSTLGSIRPKISELLEAEGALREKVDSCLPKTCSPYFDRKLSKELDEQALNSESMSDLLEILGSRRG